MMITKIRPLKKIDAGKYISNDRKWQFEKILDQWNCYKLPLHKESDYYFFYSFPTLKSLVKVIEETPVEINNL